MGEGSQGAFCAPEWPYTGRKRRWQTCNLSMRGLLDARDRSRGAHGDGVRLCLWGAGESDSADYGFVAGVYAVSGVYTAAYADSVAHVYGATDRDADGNVDRPVNAYIDSDGITESSHYIDIHTYSHTDQHAGSDRNSDAYLYTRSYGNSDANRHADSGGNPYSDSDQYAGPSSYSHTNSHER